MCIFTLGVFQQFFLAVFILSLNLSFNTSGRTKRGIRYLNSTTIPRVNRYEIGLIGFKFTYTLHFCVSNLVYTNLYLVSYEDYKSFSWKLGDQPIKNLLEKI